MLTKKQLRDIHGTNLPLHVLELDYVQSIVLMEIYKRNDNLVFKGGTCLHKAFGLNRFSEDLDFNILGGNPKKTIKAGILGLKKAGIEARIVNLEERKRVFLAKIRFQGPLYQGTPLSEGSLEIEISKLKVQERPIWETVMSPYPDTGTFSLLAMSPAEILAEKFRSLVQRKKARDLYDIWFLVRKGTTISTELIEKKFRELDMEPVNLRGIIENYDLSEKEWNRDIENLIGRVPDKEGIERVLWKLVERIG